MSEFWIYFKKHLNNGGPWTVEKDFLKSAAELVVENPKDAGLIKKSVYEFLRGLRDENRLYVACKEEVGLWKTA
jgi:hypothetical protein